MTEARAITGMMADSGGAALLGSVVTLVSLASIAVGLRLYVRQRITRELWWDDWTMLSAMVLTLVTGIVMCVMVRFGLGSHIWGVGRQQLLDYFFGYYLSSIFYNAGLGFIKASLLLQYSRILSSGMNKVAIIAMVIISMWSTALVFTSIFNCTPVEGFWNGNINSKCIPQYPFHYVSGAGNIITGLFVFALPIPALWKLALPLPQRLSLLGVFVLGFFTWVVSIVRISFPSSGVDRTYENVGPAIWTVAELCCGIIASCLPTLQPLLARRIPALRDSSRPDAGAVSIGHSKGFGVSTVISSDPELARGNASVMTSSPTEEHFEKPLGQGRTRP